MSAETNQQIEEAYGGNKGTATPAAVPHVIFFTWKSHSVPACLRKCVASFHRRNPTWSVILFSDEDCATWVSTRRPGDAGWYFALPMGILRADAMRLLWLHEYGGVYADIDVECLSALDPLAARLNASSCTIALTRDHPIHEDLHWGGGAMWMNDFMVAKPKSPILQGAIDLLKGDIASGKCFVARDAVMLTGPGLLNRAISAANGATECEVMYIPWPIVHPLPDMSNREFPGRSAIDSAIRNKAWRMPGTIVAHYWYHTWCSANNMVIEYGDVLFAGAREIVEERMHKYRDWHNTRVDTIVALLAEIAAAGQTITIVDVRRTDSRKPASRLSEWGIQCPSAGAQERTPPDANNSGFKQLAYEALAGFGLRYFSTEPMALSSEGANAETIGETTQAMEICEEIRTLVDKAAIVWTGTKAVRDCSRLIPGGWPDFCRHYQSTADVVVMGFPDAHVGENNHTETSVVESAQEILAHDLVKAGGYVFIEGCDVDACASATQLASRAVEMFVAAGWNAETRRGCIVLQKPYTQTQPIPRQIHVLCDIRRREAYHKKIIESWQRFLPDWEISYWSEVQIRDFIALEFPESLSTFMRLEKPTDRIVAGRCLILRKHGGIAIDPNVMLLRTLEEVFTGAELFLATRMLMASDAKQPQIAVSGHFMASTAQHPFWKGIEQAIKTQLGRAATDSGDTFLTRRALDMMSFADPGDAWPVFLDPQCTVEGMQVTTCNEAPDSGSLKCDALQSAHFAKVAQATLAGAGAEARACTISATQIALMTVEREPCYVQETINKLWRDWNCNEANPLLIFPGSLEATFLDRYVDKPNILIEKTTPEEWESMYWWNTHRKATWNYWRCLSRQSRDRGERATGRLVLEDDLSFAGGWTSRLDRTLQRIREEVGAVFILSLYSPHEAIKTAFAAGSMFEVYPTNSFFGTQAMFFPEAVRQDLANYIKCFGVEDNSAPYDILIAAYCEACDVPLLATVPSLVQHIGINSTGLGGGHSAPSFVPHLGGAAE